MNANALSRPMKNSVHIASALLAATLALVAQAAAQVGSHGQVMILDLSKEATDSITFHSRPVTLSGFWKPRQSDIKVCEQMAGNYLRPSTKRLSRGFKAYHRQYVGIEREGRRVLYLNAFYSNHSVRGAIVESLVNAYDGGDSFWGLVCDPRSHSVSEFEKNTG